MALACRHVQSLKPNGKFTCTSLQFLLWHAYAGIDVNGHCLLKATACALTRPYKSGLLRLENRKRQINVTMLVVPALSPTQ